MRYTFFKKLEGNAPLVVFFNQVMKELDAMRVMLAPARTFSRNYKSVPYGYPSSTAFAFYEFCLLEEYFKSVIDHLAKWSSYAEQYNGEFAGRWRYYAASDRLESINEYGGEDDDYDDDGNVLLDVTDSKLKSYSLVNQMRDYNDIFLTSKPSDWLLIYNALHVQSEMSIFKIFEHMGTPIHSHRMENGEMVQNTWADERLHEAVTQSNCDMLAAVLFSVATAVSLLAKRVNKLKPNSDNKKFFSGLPGQIDDILNLRIPQLQLKGGQL